VAGIDADIAGEQAHTKALDANTKGSLRDIHRLIELGILAAERRSTFEPLSDASGTHFVRSS
jgi:hypothetical protein